MKPNTEDRKTLNITISPKGVIMEEKGLRDILIELVRIVGYNYNKPHTAEDEYKWIDQAISDILKLNMIDKDKLLLTINNWQTFSDEHQNVNDLVRDIIALPEIRSEKMKKKSLVGWIHDEFVLDSFEEGVIPTVLLKKCGDMKFRTKVRITIEEIKERIG